MPLQTPIDLGPHLNKFWEACVDLFFEVSEDATLTAHNQKLIEKIAIQLVDMRDPEDKCISAGSTMIMVNHLQKRFNNM